MLKRLIEWSLKVTGLYYPVLNVRAKIMAPHNLRKWTRAGRPVPPPHVVKHLALRYYAEKHGLRILVETGTFRGDTVEAMKRRFDRVFTIELSREFYDAARLRFRGDPNVEVIQGDSAKLLGSLIQRIEEPALFWLDGHHSGWKTARGDKDTPVLEELEQIFGGYDRRSVVVIDDARDFGKKPTYPTIAQLRSFVMARNPGVDFEVRDDMIRITPA
jgi:hypothetical protein